MKWTTGMGKSGSAARCMREIAKQGGRSLIIKPGGAFVRVSEVDGRICYSKLLPVKRPEPRRFVILDEVAVIGSPWK